MATVVFPEINQANNAITTLNGSISDSATSVVLATGGAAALGFSGATTDAYITVIDATTWRKNPLTSPETLEIMQVTAVSGDTLTVTRGVDGTSGTAFADGSIVELRINAAMIQRIYDALTDGTDDLKFNRAELGAGGAGVTHNNSALQIDETAGGLISAGCEANGNKSFWIADPDEPDAVQLQYAEPTKALRLGTKVAGGNMQFRTGDNVTCVTFDSSQNATFAAEVSVEGNIGGPKTTTTGDGDDDIFFTLTNWVDFTFGAQNNTIRFFPPTQPGMIIFMLTQDGVGSRTVTWTPNSGSMKWVGGSAPTLTTAAGATDVLQFFFDGTDYYEVSRALDVK